MQFRIASFNAENLFNRPKAFTLDDFEEGDRVLRLVADFQARIQQARYTAVAKREILALWPQITSYVTLVESHGKLMSGNKKKVVATGRHSWYGFIRFKRKKFSDKTITNTARVLKAVNPDVCAVVEVEDRTTLDRFAAERLVWTKNRNKQRYRYNMLVDGNDRRGIDVGLLSKYPIGGVWSHIDDKKGTSRIFSRDCPEMQVELPNGQVLWMVINHLKSKGYGRPATNNARRKRQATRLAEIMGQYDLAQDLVVVAGDLNDTPDSDPLSPLMGLADLHDVLGWKFPEVKDRWTYSYRGKNSQLDYLLVSTPLRDALVDAGVERRGIYQVAKQSVSGETHFKSVTSDANSASDHGCVWADFRL